MHARYFVDNRSGCVAVRDRQNTDPEHSGLWPDTKGVMQFWSKKLVESKCPTCGHMTSDWGEGTKTIAEANALATKLNQADRRSRPVNLTDEQKAVIHDAIDQLHDRLLYSRVEIAQFEPTTLKEHDDYTEQVGALLALF